jgi:hypothetical protein
MSGRVRYALTIFAGAFLLFQIQPLFARFILPWFGGSASVWATCLLFFQAILLAGYTYAHLLTRLLRPRWQAVVHLVLVLGSLALLPITPASSWKPSGAGSPAFDILLLSVATIGLPCLLVASTSPLMQSWFSTTSDASPYQLYALANLGSLLGLLTYPFAIEPMLGLRDQTVFWSIGYGAFVAFTAWCAIAMIRGNFPAHADTHAEALEDPERASHLALWLGLSAFGVILLLAITNEMTKNISPFPFLWVLPLALYLISFILCFAGPRWYHRRLWVSVFSTALIPTLWLSYIWRSIGLAALVIVCSIALFAGSMICHGELARLKPGNRKLTGFYLTVAVGGVLGGAFVSLVAPNLFTRFWELPIALTGTFVLAGICMARRSPGRQLGIYVVWAGAAAVLLLIGALPMRAERSYIASERNFYGRVSVSEVRQGEHLVREMLHGRVRHGSQIMERGGARIPTLYYRNESGIGRAIAALRERGSLRIGVIGLGVGALAAYGERGDSIRFYEINPAVERMARRYFTFLDETPAEVDVAIGDARILLERELAGKEPNRFDVLVLDAFSSDAIPVHLLTREAFALYEHHLAADGLLVLNIANTYLDLEPVVRGAAETLHAHAALIRTEPNRTEPAGSSWALITRAPGLLHHPRIAPAITPWSSSSPAVHWTDDHSNLLGVLR